MRLKYLALGLAAVIAAPAAVATAQAADGIFVPLFTYRTGPFAGSGIPIANGMADYLNMLNERDGGIGGVKLVIEECETGYDTKKGVECYEAVKGKKPVVDQSVVDGHHPAADPQGGGRQDPDPVHGLWPLCLRRRQPVPLGVQPAGHLLGRASVIVRMSATRKAASTSSRARRSATSISMRRYGKEPIPLLEELAKDYGFDAEALSGAGLEMQNQSSQWLEVRRDRPDYICDVGLGRDEPDRRQGSREDRLPDEQVRRRLVAGRDDDARRPARRPRAIRRSTSTRSAPTSRCSRTSRSTSSTRARARHVEGQGRRELLQSRRLQLDADRRGDPQRPEDDRQEGGHRRGRAARPRERSTSRPRG